MGEFYHPEIIVQREIIIYRFLFENRITFLHYNEHMLIINDVL